MQHNPSGTLMQQFCQQPISHRLWSQLCPQVKCRGFSHHSKSLPITLHSWCKHPKRLEPVSNMTENMEITEESKGRQDLFARFPGYLCALLAILQACSIQHVLSRGSWLLTQKLCKFLGWSIGRQRQSLWKKKACKNSVHVAIYNNSMRLSLTHDCKYAQDLQHLLRTKETNANWRHRQWIIPGGVSFPQLPRMQEYEYFTKCMYKSNALLLSNAKHRKRFCKWFT